MHLAGKMPAHQVRRRAVGEERRRLQQAMRGAMEWPELADAQPRLTGLGRERLLDRGVVLVGTIRADEDP